MHFTTKIKQRHAYLFAFGPSVLIRSILRKGEPNRKSLALKKIRNRSFMHFGRKIDNIYFLQFKFWASNRFNNSHEQISIRPIWIVFSGLFISFQFAALHVVDKYLRANNANCSVFSNIEINKCSLSVYQPALVTLKYVQRMHISLTEGFEDV